MTPELTDIKKYLEKYTNEKEAIKHLANDAGIDEERVKSRIKLFRDTGGDV